MKVEICDDGRKSEHPFGSRNQSFLRIAYECPMNFYCLTSFLKLTSKTKMKLLMQSMITKSAKKEQKDS